MIRSSKHSTKFANLGKQSKLKEFLREYRRVGQLIIDGIWQNGYSGNFIDKESGETKIFAFIPSLDKLELPSYIVYQDFKNIQTTLSARAMSSLVTQVRGAIQAAVLKRKNTLFVKNKLENHSIELKNSTEYTEEEKLKLILENEKSLKRIEKLLARNYKLIKPNFLNVCAELSSKCCDIQKNDGEFDYFLRIKSIGDDFGHINIPIKKTSISNKWNDIGEMMGSFLISDSNIFIRFERENSKATKDGISLGIDQGLNDVACCSDKQTTPKEDIHHHTFHSILDKISRKRKGSKAFKRACDHRKNFINWSLNQLDLSKCKEVRLEKVKKIRFKSRTTRKLSHWTYTEISKKIKSLCEVAEVPLIEQDSTYASQRCYECGIVRKANRKGKLYRCKHCGYEADADYNASLNHSLGLNPIDWRLRGKGYNLKDGFYWKPSGLFNFDGSELRVPIS